MNQKIHIIYPGVGPFGAVAVEKVLLILQISYMS